MNSSRIFRLLALSAALTAIAVLVAVTAGITKIPIALLWLTAEAFLVCWAARSELLRNVGLAAGATLLLVAVADLGLRPFDTDSSVDHWPGDPYDKRGFGIARPAIEHFPAWSTAAATGEVMYRVTYSLDRNGFRFTEGGGAGADTYLFFGDSFTYGEGLQDDETIPARFARDLGSRVTAVNLGFHGFGPQNMLRLIETDGFAAAVTGPVKGAFYLAIEDHVDRAVGRYPWNLQSARYILDASGEPQFAGPFASYPASWLLDRMELWRGLPRLLSRTIREIAMPHARRVEIAAAIIARSARLLAERSHVGLMVLLWDSPDTGDLEAALARRRIGAVRLSGIIGNLDRPGMRIHPPFEMHPSALAASQIAAWLARGAAASAGSDRAGP